MIFIGTVTGKDALIYIASGGGSYANARTHSQYGISDFSLTFSRGTVEQELVGETGNWFTPGALSIEGSYTACKFGTSGMAEDLYSIVNSKLVAISGSTGSNFKWYFPSCQITGFDVSVGDADTISEASIDFQVMDPFLCWWDTTNYIAKTVV